VADSRIAARRYAQALLQVLRDEDHAERCLSDLREAALVLQDDAIGHDVLTNPVVPVSEVQSLVAKMARTLNLDETSTSFLQVLAGHRRLAEVGLIIEEFGALLDRRAGRVRGELVSSGPLSDAQKERLRAVVGQRLEKELLLTSRIDPGLIDGVRITVQDRVLDLSARSYLDALGEHLQKNG